jgi:transcriptional regulator with XRE-family HTH domain
METRGRKPNAARRLAVAELRAQGLSFQAIGQRLGISRQSVQQMLVASGLPDPGPPGLLCSECGVIIVKNRGPWLHNRSVLCLPCLAKQPQTTFAQRLKAHRLAAGLTLKQLGKLTGLCPETIGNYEQGAMEPRWPVLARLICVLGVSLVDLNNELTGGSPKAATSTE